METPSLGRIPECFFDPIDDSSESTNQPVFARIEIPVIRLIMVKRRSIHRQ